MSLSNLLGEIEKPQKQNITLQRLTLVTKYHSVMSKQLPNIILSQFSPNKLPTTCGVMSLCLQYSYPSSNIAKDTS